MGGSGGFSPLSIITGLVFKALASEQVQPPAPAPDTSAQAEAARQAEERDAQARRAEDRRAEEAALRAQARKQQLSQRPEGGLSDSLGEGGSLAGQSMHGAVSTRPQLKERLGQ